MSYPTIGRLICLQKHFENSQISRFLFHLKNNTIHSTAMLLACTYHHIVGPFRQGETKSGRHPRGCLCARARAHTRQLWWCCTVTAGPLWRVKFTPAELAAFGCWWNNHNNVFFWGNLEDRNAKLAIKIWPFSELFSCWSLSYKLFSFLTRNFSNFCW